MSASPFTPCSVAGTAPAGGSSPWHSPISTPPTRRRGQSEQAEEPVAWDHPGVEAEQQQTGWRLLETFFRESPIREAGKPDAVEVIVEADLGQPRFAHAGRRARSGAERDDHRLQDQQHARPTRIAPRWSTAPRPRRTRCSTGKTPAGRKPASSCTTWSSSRHPSSWSSAAARGRAGAIPALPGHRRLRRGPGRRDFIPSPGLQCVTCEFFHECAAWH